VARERPTASNDSPPLTGVDSDGPILTRAEARALKRSSPLTREQFKKRGRLAAGGNNPLRTLLRQPEDAARTRGGRLPAGG
jgi:hypothetical protein